MEENTSQVKKIGMLLDINNLYGQHEGRLAPWMYVLCIGLGPTLIYVYLNGFYYIPLYLWIPVTVILLIRLIMIFPGREKYRKKIFKRQLNDDYMDSATLMQIKVLHPDGCIEFINGTIMYLVSAFNGTNEDDVQSTVQLRKFLRAAFAGFNFDTYIHNINDSQSLRNYYAKVAQFGHNESASNFVKMIDHNIKLTIETSTVQQTIYAVYSYKSDWKTIKTQVDSAIQSTISRRYKNVYRVNDADEINTIFNRDSDTIINIEALMRQKYANEAYYNAKVIAYDLPEDKVVVQGKQTRHPILPEQTPQSFHKQFDPNTQRGPVTELQSKNKGPRRT